MLFAAIFTAFAGVYISSLVAHLVKNYRIARKTGFPVVITPINPDNPLWLLINAFIYKPLRRILPASWFLRLKPVCYGWEFKEQRDGPSSMHEMVGESFWLVSGSDPEFVTRDTTFAQIFCAKHRNFVPLKAAAYVMGLQGSNILTVSGTKYDSRREKFLKDHGQKF